MNELFKNLMNRSAPEVMTQRVASSVDGQNIKSGNKTSRFEQNIDEIQKKPGFIRPRPRSIFEELDGFDSMSRLEYEAVLERQTLGTDQRNKHESKKGITKRQAVKTQESNPDHSVDNRLSNLDERIDVLVEKSLIKHQLNNPQEPNLSPGLPKSLETQSEVVNHDRDSKTISPINESGNSETAPSSQFDSTETGSSAEYKQWGKTATENLTSDQKIADTRIAVKPKNPDPPIRGEKDKTKANLPIKIQKAQLISQSNQVDTKLSLNDRVNRMTVYSQSGLKLRQAVQGEINGIPKTEHQPIDINIRIGRVEIRASNKTFDTAQQTVAETKSSNMDLDDYLKKRDGGSL
jgi:hypothetical protein